MSVIRKKISIKSFRLFDFRVYDDKNEQSEKLEFQIQMFGINERGETCSITVNDYKPFFYIMVHDTWSTTDNILFRQFLKEKTKWDTVESMDIVQHKKLYGFTGGKKHKFVKLTFQSSIAMSKIRRLWYVTGTMKPISFQGRLLEIYESSIPPLLRYFHIQNVSPSGWVQLQKSKAKQPQCKTTTCDFEYICSKSAITPLPEKETRVPYKICSFDIEASSSHGDFPVPIKSYKRLATQIYDSYNTHKPEQKRMNLFLQRCILTAFEFDKFNGIDLVYPTRKCDKKDIQTRISKFLKTTIDDAEIVKSDEVQSIFKVMKSFQRKNDDEDSDDEYAHEFQHNKKGKKEDKATIVDVLCNDIYARDEKIQHLDVLMTSLFPKLEGDKVTFIGSTFMHYGEKEPYFNHCLVVGSCDEVPNATIETCEDEYSLLIKWMELIQNENPDIIIGYNIFGFDYEFMFRRSQELQCDREFLQLSRRTDDICATLKDCKFEIENTRVVLASGEYDLKYYNMVGRMQIDLYTYFRRDFNLSSYKLDDVAGEFISDDIVKTNLTYDESDHPVTELYSKNVMGLHTGDYIHIEICGFTTDHYNDGAKFYVKKLEKREEDGKSWSVLTIQDHHDFDKKIKWTMAKDDVTPQDIFRLTRGSSADRAKVAKYCIQDCNLVHHLMNKIDVLTGYIEMSSICSVPMSFLVFRGQGIKLTSYVAKKCMEKDTLMPDLDKKGENEGYEGAIVLPPKCDMYMDRPVACVDYSSLYPSSMISQNYSHDSKVWTKEYDLAGNLVKETGEKDASGNYIYDNLPHYQYIEIEFDTFRYIRKSAKSKEEKTKTGKKICRWAQLPNNEKSIMPAILQELLKARSSTKKLMKKETDPFMQNILDKRQLGYKVTANSLYGQCGARTSTFYEKDVAASTTATGRMMIMYAKGMIEEIYGNAECNTENYGPVLTKAEYVYGDSVASYTPVYIRVNGQTEICSIEELGKYGSFQWRKYGKTKECIDVRNLNIETWSDKGWTPLQLIIRHKLDPSKNMYRVQTHCGLVDVTSDHSLLNERGESVKPCECQVGVTKLLHHKLPSEQMEQYSTTKIKDMYSTCSNNHVEIAKYVSQIDDKDYSLTGLDRVLQLTINKRKTFESHHGIIDIHEIQYSHSEYVYDLTTENHHFAAGIGNMIVHNTDSVFFTFNLEDPKTKEPIRGKKALEITIEIAQEAAQICTDWLKPPMNLEYEKTLMPFILLSKKRYVGMLYEDDPNKGKLKYMGLSLKRRDSCDYLKDTYGEILNILMKENDVEKSIQYLNQCLEDLVNGKVHMDKLAITRALRSEYKNPQQIAHRVLADRIGQRDPGNKPKPGDRIKYVFIDACKPKALLGERVETPEFIIDNKLKIDYTYYVTNQLMKPLQQLYGLALVPIWKHRNKNGAIKEYTKDISQMEKSYGMDYEDYMKRKEKYCSAKVKTILFDDILNKINRNRNNMQSIRNFFV